MIKTFTKSVLVCAIILWQFPISSAQAQIAGWFFKTLDGSSVWQNDDGSLPTKEAILLNPNLNPAVLSRGAGLITAAANTRSFNAVISMVSATVDDAKTNNQYYQLTIQAKTGFTATITSINYKIRRQNASAPDKFIWRYSTNGTTFFDLTAGNDTETGTDVNGTAHSVLGISNPALTNVPSTATITLRLYYWGGSDPASGFAIAKSVNATSPEYTALAIGGSVGNVLPVSLVSFNGKAQKNAVQLSWATASEHNNSHFEVLRSASGEPNVVIGTVKGNGTTTAVQHYNFTDYSPLLNAYYQLRQVDFDGKSDKSSIIHISSDLKENSFKIATGNGKLTANVFSDLAGKGTFTVTDLNGKNIAVHQVNLFSGFTQLEIPVSWQTGMYVANITDSQGKSMRTKFIY